MERFNPIPEIVSNKADGSVIEVQHSQKDDTKISKSDLETMLKQAVGKKEIIPEKRKLQTNLFDLEGMSVRKKLTYFMVCKNSGAVRK